MPRYKTSGYMKPDDSEQKAARRRMYISIGICILMGAMCILYVALNM